MALINCPECNKDISDKAVSCPNCGFPIQEMKKPKFSSDGVNICPKCGNFTLRIGKCPDCEIDMVDCHMPSKEWVQMPLDVMRQWKQQMRERYVVGSPEFDEALYNKRLQEEKVEEDYYASIPRKPSEPKITCLYCKSTNTKKIGVVSRSVSVGLFGLGSKKINRQWHCNNCGSDF